MPNTRSQILDRCFMQIDSTVNLTCYPDHVDFDVDYNKTMYDLFKLGLENYFVKLYKDIGYVNSVIDKAFKSAPKSITSIAIRIGVVCGKDIKISRDNKHRFWLFVDDKSFRVGSVGNYFDRILLDKIRSVLGIINPYAKQFFTQEISHNVLNSINIPKPSFLDLYARRRKEFTFDTGGFKEGNWIVVKGFIKYNMFGKDQISVGVSFTTGLINRSLFSCLHTTRSMDIGNEEYNWYEKSNISDLVAESVIELIFN